MKYQHLHLGWKNMPGACSVNFPSRHQENNHHRTQEESCPVPVLLVGLVVVLLKIIIMVVLNLVLTLQLLLSDELRQ
jgi:hypothetical protein